MQKKRKLIFGIIFALVSVLGGCGYFVDGPYSKKWYNIGGFRSVFGDYDPVNSKIAPQKKDHDALIARGEYLVRGPAACATCHVSPTQKKQYQMPETKLSGGLLFSDEFSSDFNIPNITPDKDTGIGNWAVPEIVRAIRASIDNKGRPLSIAAHQDYRWLSDRDAKAISLYLLSQTPIKNKLERRRLGGLERNRLWLVPLHEDVSGYVPVYSEGENLGYGRYLTNNVARCRTCHTGQDGWFSKAKPFEGSEVNHDSGSWFDIFSDDSLASQRVIFPYGGPNILGRDAEGLKDWNKNDVINFLKTGFPKNGKKVNGGLCPWPAFSNMTETDLNTVALYIKSLS